jgi:hypothetical protein
MEIGRHKIRFLLEEKIMFGHFVKAKMPICCESFENAYQAFWLEEDSEPGKIINEYYLILDDADTFYFKKGRYVNTIDIRYLDIFETDINYDDRSDLTKINTVHQRFYENGIRKEIKLNRYARMK